jgi:tetratricopeptide (TPR) repeat protein
MRKIAEDFMKNLGAFFHRSVAVLACSAILFQSLPLNAQSTDVDARRHFEAGESYFRTSDYDGALREFQQAYSLSKRPVILLSIAAVYERMAKLEESVSTLEKYLRVDPDSSDKSTIELRIENLKRRIESQKKAAPPPAASVSAATPPASASAPPAPSAVPPPEAQPANHTAAYVTLGIAGAAALGAIVTGIIAKGKYNDADNGCHQTPAGCSDSDISPVKSMALISTVLTGVAVVGAGVGTVLYLTAKPESAEKSTGFVPNLSAGAWSSGGRVQAQWSF